MEIRSTPGSRAELECDALVVFLAEGVQPQGLTDARISEVMASGEFAGKPLDLAVLHRPEGLKAKRLVLAGAGPESKFTAEEARKLAGATLRTLKSRGMRSIGFDTTAMSPEMAEATVEGALLGDFEPDAHKTDPKKNEKAVDSVAMLGASQEAVERGIILGEAQNFTRALVNEPGNLLTPVKLAERAQAMAAAAGLPCEVLDENQMKELGMGSLLSVGMGSYQMPRFIVIRYTPAGGADGKPHLGLVGKGVTFDTGGISIKPSESMEKMKYDMAGGAAVIGAMQAISKLKPEIPVTAFIPAVENMPSGRAVRPGDIVTSLAGKTIEVLNTDAEGRLILIDAIEYAKRTGCTHLVDAATLTGSIVVALGHLRIGAFTNNEDFLGKVLAASRAEGERMWQMPLDDEYRDGLKTPFADIANIGSRAGGSITAAMFLKEWVGDTPWVHLDIAGTAWLDDAKPWMSKGPTGVCVRTFSRLATQFSILG